MNNINDFSVGGRSPKPRLSRTHSKPCTATPRHRAARHRRETFDAVKMLKSADPVEVQTRARRRLSQGTLRRQPAPTGSTHQSESRRAGGVCRHRRMGPSRQRRRNRRPDRQRAARLIAIDRRVLDRSWRPRGRHGRRDHVGVGRTARENGNRGTDHGHANVMFVLGGPIKGGRVSGRGGRGSISLNFTKAAIWL